MSNTSKADQGHKYIGLDHLRALAINFVFFYHYKLFKHPQWVADLSTFGWVGVDLFFVLSGFLIAGQLFSRLKKNKPIPLSEFVIKRFFRIVPPFLVAISLYTLFPTIQEKRPGMVQSMAPLWQYLTFTVNFDLDLSKTATFTHAWSLCIEEQFYLVLPFMLVVAQRINAGTRAIYGMLLLFLGGIIGRSWIWYEAVVPHLSGADSWVYWYKYIYYPTYNRLDGLLVGVSLAGLYTFYPQLRQKADKMGNALLIVGGTLLVVAYGLCSNQVSYFTSVWGFPLISLAFGFIVAASVSPSCFLYHAQSTITTWLATLAYAIYLFHKMIIYSLQKAVAHLTPIAEDGNLMLVLSISATLIGAWFIHQVIERPALKLRNRVLRGRRKKTPSTQVLS